MDKYACFPADDGPISLTVMRSTPDPAISKVNYPLAVSEQQLQAFVTRKRKLQTVRLKPRELATLLSGYGEEPCPGPHTQTFFSEGLGPERRARASVSC